MTGLNGYMLLDLYDRGYNRDDALPIGFSGMLTHLGRITDTGFAGMCFCPDPSSDNFGLNQFTGDVGLGLWGGLLGLRAYVLESKDGEPVVLGGKLTGTAAAGVSLTPWAGNDHRVRWMAEKPVFFDVEGQVIRSITRKEGGNRWIIKLENNSKVSSRSRLSIAGLEPGTWSVSHRINKGSELESNRKEITEDEFVLERKLRPGTKVELILAREISE